MLHAVLRLQHVLRLPALPPFLAVVDAQLLPLPDRPAGHEHEVRVTVAVVPQVGHGRACQEGGGLAEETACERCGGMGGGGSQGPEDPKPPPPPSPPWGGLSTADMQTRKKKILKIPVRDVYVPALDGCGERGGDFDGGRLRGGENTLSIGKQ